MDRLSEAGELYLDNYFVLEKANNEVENYLDSVLNNTIKLVLEGLKDLNSDYFEWSYRVNNSNPGTIQFWPVNLIESNVFRLDQKDIYVKYNDIRRFSDYEKSDSVKIYMYNPNVSSYLEDIIGKIVKYKDLDKIYKEEFISLDLGNSINSAEKISEKILNRCEAVNDLILKINNADNLFEEVISVIKDKFSNLDFNYYFDSTNNMQHLNKNIWSHKNLKVSLEYELSLEKIILNQGFNVMIIARRRDRNRFINFVGEKYSDLLDFNKDKNIRFSPIEKEIAIAYKNYNFDDKETLMEEINRSTEDFKPIIGKIDGMIEEFNR